MEKIKDLRDWLVNVEGIGELRRVNGADWNVEIGVITELNTRRKNSPALLFDHIKGYPEDYRILTSALTSSRRLGITLNVPSAFTDRELIDALQGKAKEWEARSKDYPPKVVATGPVKQNLLAGEEVDLLKFPTPKWHEHDGGRYIGTGCAVITRDPDTGWVNLGSYRIMIHDKKTVGFHIGPFHHGRMHYEKYHAKDKACPVAISVGHDPALLYAAGLEVPLGLSEYNYVGAIKGEPVDVIEGQVTGLPIPATAEIVLEGWCPPRQTRDEGEFGEWHGYYAGGVKPDPIVHVECIYHRNGPIILGAPPGRPPHDYTYMKCVGRSILIQEALAKAGVPDVRGVWAHEAGDSRGLIIVSLKQRYPGHARQAALVACMCSAGGFQNRYVVVVDEDIDPCNIHDVLWALCTRSDPENDIDIIRRTLGAPCDPAFRRPHSGFTSKAIIDACKPFEWIEEFPRVAESSPGIQNKIKEKWKSLFE
jgi:UbiD family decarboxylase